MSSIKVDVHFNKYCTWVFHICDFLIYFDAKKEMACCVFSVLCFVSSLRVGRAVLSANNNPGELAFLATHQDIFKETIFHSIFHIIYVIAGR